jgi:hypothetical protein
MRVHYNYDILYWLGWQVTDWSLRPEVTGMKEEASSFESEHPVYLPLWF